MDEIAELPRVVLEASPDGMARFKTRLRAECHYGELKEDIDLLVIINEDGDLWVATRPVANPQWTWSPPAYAERA